MKKRFFTPDIASWKYVQAKPVKIKRKKLKPIRSFGSEYMDWNGRGSKFEKLIDNSTELVDFAISFTKTVVRISFVLFVIVNLYILTMTSIHYYNTNELLFMDTLITESYGMLRDVIAAYIIKAATENSLRIAFSVLSDYLDKKYNIKVEPTEDTTIPDNDLTDIDITEDEDPGEFFEEEIDEDNMEGGIDIIEKGKK